jgi:hypothetical protein
MQALAGLAFTSYSGGAPLLPPSAPLDADMASS